ncbi:hypothetical protein KKH05_02415 [Patescibacteria group bacterium]|nr:hypothetical protein [Patescibacteria group bacterium]
MKLKHMVVTSTVAAAVLAVPASRRMTFTRVYYRKRRRLTSMPAGTVERAAVTAAAKRFMFRGNVAPKAMLKEIDALLDDYVPKEES